MAQTKKFRKFRRRGRRLPVKALIRREIKKNEKRVVEQKLVVSKNTYPVGAGGLSGATGGGLRYVLNDLLQGDDDQGEIIGRKVTMKSLQFRYGIQANPTAVASKVRVMLILMKNNTGTPALGSLIEDVTSEEYAFTTPFRRDPTINYTVLYDKTHVAVQGSASQRWVSPKVRIDLKDRAQTKNIADTATYSNSLWLIAYSDDNTNRPGFYFYNQYRYTDQ